MKIYFSIKNLESEGIVGFEGEPSHTDTHYITTSPQTTGRRRFEKLGSTCFESLGEARKAALHKVQKRIVQTEKKLARLKKLQDKLEREYHEVPTPPNNPMPENKETETCRCEICEDPCNENERIGCENCSRMFGPCCNSADDPDCCMECA